MFNAESIQSRLRQQPFRPLRIVTSSGEAIDVTHPDLVLVGARDIIIGGTGADNLTASNFDDLLVAGTTDHDASDAALSLILAEWRRNDAGYSARLDHLTGNAGSGLNLTFLLNNQTAHDDNVRDVLRGENDFDWFLANVVGTGIADRVIAAPGEVTTDIDP